MFFTISLISRGSRSGFIHHLLMKLCDCGNVSQPIHNKRKLHHQLFPNKVAFSLVELDSIINRSNRSIE